MKNIQCFLELHDAEIVKISCDYNMRNTDIQLKTDQNNEMFFRFSDVFYMEVNMCEPWGEGIYVFETEIYKAKDMKRKLGKRYNIKMINASLFYILLNSGDEIIIVSKEFKTT